MADSESPQTGFSSFKKRKKIIVNRKRKNESSESDEDDVSAVKKVERVGRKYKVLGNSSCPGKVGLNPDKAKARSSNRDSDSDDQNVDNGNDSVRSKKNISVTYDSSRTGKREGPDDMGATSVLEIETEFDRDAQAVYEKQLKVNKEKKGEEDDKLYKGQSGYAKYYEKRDTAQGNAASGMVRLVLMFRCNYIVSSDCL